MKFLSKPSAGWSTLTINDFSIGVSYLTSVPRDCLQSACRALVEGLDFCVSFETEGRGDVKVIADDYRVYVIHEIDPIRLIVNDNITKFSIIDALQKDIGDNLSEWARWEIFSDEDDEEAVKEEIENNIKEFQNMLNVIKDNI